MATISLRELEFIEPDTATRAEGMRAKGTRLVRNKGSFAEDRDNPIIANCSVQNGCLMTRSGRNVKPIRANNGIGRLTLSLESTAPSGDGMELTRSD